MGVGIGPAWGRPRPHRAFTRDLRGPFVAAGGLGARGVYVGPNWMGGASFVFDPFELYHEHVESPNVVVIGEQGRASRRW